MYLYFKFKKDVLDRCKKMESDVGSDDEYVYLQNLVEKHCNISDANLKKPRYEDMVFSF